MRRLPIYILMIIALPAFSQEGLTLQQALETALKNNYSILLQRNEAAIASNNATLGNAGALPRVDATVIQNNTITDTKQNYSNGSEVNRSGAASHSINASADLNWTVFDGFRMFAAYDRLKEMERAGEVATRASIESTVALVIAGYYNVIKQNVLLSVIDSSRSISRVKLNIAKTKFDIGSGSKVEYLQAQVDMNADESAYKRQMLEIDQSEVRLNQLMARPVNIQFVPTDSFILDNIPAYEEVLSLVEDQNTSIQLAKSDIEVYHFAIKELQGERLPWLGVNAGYSYLKSSSDANLILDNRVTGWNYGFTVSWNIFNGFNLNRNIKNAKLEYENANIRLSDVRTDVNANLLVAYKQLQSYLEILVMEQTNATLAKENIDLALERFRVGVIDELDLKEAQHSYTEALNRLVNISYDTKIAETAVKRLAGTLMK